jgi:hypothetical protein
MNSYVLYIYNYFEKKIEKLERVMLSSQWHDHARKYYTNQSIYLKDWQCYMVQEFNEEGLPTERYWTFYKGG